MFAHKIMGAMKNLDFITDMYSLSDNAVCVDSNTINFAVRNVDDRKMTLCMFVGDKHLFNKVYNINDVDTMIDEIQKHYLVLV